MVRDNRGFTLMEVLMVAATVGLVALITPQIITNMTKIFVLSRTKLELQREARAALYLITRELRQAQSSTLVVDQISGQPYSSRIRFTLVQGSSVTIAQTGSDLVHTKGIVTTTLSKNIAYLAFTFPRSDDMTIASVSLTLQQQIYNGLYKALHMASEKVRIMN